MRQVLLRILRRAILVAVVLGAVGYIFAEIYLVLYRMNGGAPDPANEAVRWKAPLRMAVFGVGLLVVLELLIHFLRRKQPVVPTSLDESPIPPQKPDAAP
jgi:hypothetical protein